MTQNVSGWLPNLIGPVVLADEGVPVPARATINFTGAGVTATDNPGQNRTDVTIPGGGGGSTLPKTRTVVTKTTTYTITLFDDLVVLLTNTGFTVSLPPSPSDGYEFEVANRAAGTNTVAGNGHNINGVSTQPLAQYQSMTFTYCLATTEWIAT